MSVRRIGRSCLVLVVVAAGSVVGASAVAAAPRVAFTARVALSPAATTVGAVVTAGVGRTSVPVGDRITKIALNWGDRTRTVVLASRASRPTHRYSRPGRYVVHLAVTDKHKRVSRATAVETITAPGGSYSGTTSQQLFGGVGFYVSYNRTSLQQITIPLTRLQCAPGGAVMSDQFAIDSIAITANGTFSATAKQTGAYAGFPATFTYSFAGRFTGRNSAGAVTGSGSYRETIRYTDSAARTCTTNAQTWTVTRDTQPAQSAAAPKTGSYSGTTSQQLFGGVTFYVSDNRRRLQQVSVPLTRLQCTPGGTVSSDQLAVASIPIAANGSFAATTRQTGVYAGQPATFTYVFRGNFHSVDRNGVQRAAGSYRETISYTDSAPRTCTTDNQTWTITRDAQPAQPTGLPKAGNYTGTTSQQLFGGVSFTVAGSRRQLQQISVPLTQLRCVPGGATMSDQLAIPSATVAADGSFSASTTQTGVVSGHAATFRYAFSGNVHGVDRNGVPRAAGSYRETITYTDSAPRTCTTDDQTWYATRTG